MKKTEVYSWRIRPDLKNALEEAARAERMSLARLLDQIATQWLEQKSGSGGEEAIQQRLHRAAVKTFGSIHGGDPHRAEQARQRIRARLKKRHAS